MGWVYPQYREFRLRSWHIPRCSPDMTYGLLLTTCWRKSALRSCHCLVVTSLWCKKQTHGLCANKQLEVRSETSLPLDEVTSEKISSQWRWAKKVMSWKQLRCWTRVMTSWISSNVFQPLSRYKWLGTSTFGAHSHRWACATQSFQVGGTSCCSSGFGTSRRGRGSFLCCALRSYRPPAPLKFVGLSGLLQGKANLLVSCPTHDLVYAWPDGVDLQVSHTVGRVWGACWDAGFFCIFTLLANASWFSDVWQRDDALGARWGCSSFSGQHAMRGGQTCFRQCSVTEYSVHFSQRTPLHCFFTLESHFEDSWSRRHWFFSVVWPVQVPLVSAKVHFRCFPVTSRSPSLYI